MVKKINKIKTIYNVTLDMYYVRNNQGPYNLSVYRDA